MIFQAINSQIEDQTQKYLEPLADKVASGVWLLPFGFTGFSPLWNPDIDLYCLVDFARTKTNSATIQYTDDEQETSPKISFFQHTFPTTWSIPTAPTNTKQFRAEMVLISGKVIQEGQLLPWLFILAETVLPRHQRLNTDIITYSSYQLSPLRAHYLKCGVVKEESVTILRFTWLKELVSRLGASREGRTSRAWLERILN